ncbi:MAG TPA: diacylglycerol kinase family protein [Burkholderiales bacterium]
MAAVFLVLNTGSGRRDRAKALQEIEGALQAAGRRYEVFKVARGRDVAAVAARAAGLAAGCGGILAAAGGDGTLNSVAHAALDADVPFGVVPLGTFNYFARENGIPLETAAAAAALSEGTEHPVQVGLVNGHVFLVNASLGFYPRLLEDREAFKQQYGRTRWVALLAALWTLLVRAHPKLVVRLTARGEMQVQRISTLFVGNNPLQLARLGIREAQAVEAGQLAAIRVRPTGAWGLLDILLYGAVGRLGQAAGVEAFAFHEMEVAPLRPRRRALFVKVAIDGESLRLKLPLLFRVAPRRLRLLRPGGTA